jgi:hypothetical protein
MNMLEFIHNFNRHGGWPMKNHYTEAEQVLDPPPGPGPGLVKSRPLRAADPAAAQVHATLAVADQLTRIANALERLAGQQQHPEPR